MLSPPNCLHSHMRRTPSCHTCAHTRRVPPPRHRCALHHHHHRRAALTASCRRARKCPSAPRSLQDTARRSRSSSARGLVLGALSKTPLAIARATPACVFHRRTGTWKKYNAPDFIGTPVGARHFDDIKATTTAFGLQLPASLFASSTTSKRNVRRIKFFCIATQRTTTTRSKK